MARLEMMLKDRIDWVAKGTKIETLTDDDDVRTWLVFGRIAMFATIWMAMVAVVALVVAVRF